MRLLRNIHLQLFFFKKSQVSHNRIYFSKEFQRDETNTYNHKNLNYNVTFPISHGLTI